MTRLGASGTEGILEGEVYIQSKIDGTNSSVFLNEDGTIGCGSRRRNLNKFEDNQGFYNHFSKNENIKKYLEKHPTHRLFGEFLKPHSLRTYIDTAWDKFYVFDVCIDDSEDEMNYLSFDEYQPLLEEFGIDYIPILAKLTNPTIEQLTEIMNQNTYLIKENCGCGEGIVIKNYNYRNKYGNIVWAKMISSEYLDKRSKTNSEKVNAMPVEVKISHRFATDALIEKEYQKIINGDNFDPITERRRIIPCLLQTVYNSIIEEEMWNIIKDYKNPTIDFKRLQKEITNRIKIYKSDLFVKEE